MQLLTPTFIICLTPILIRTYENFELIVLFHPTIQVFHQKEGKRKFIAHSSFAITVLDQPEGDLLNFDRKENLSNNGCVMNNSHKGMSLFFVEFSRKLHEKIHNAYKNLEKLQLLLYNLSALGR